MLAVTFVRTTGAGMLSFDDNSGGAYTGWTFGGSDGTYIVSSYINVGTSWLTNYGTGFDSYSYQTYIHEIGHALGLGHAGPYNGGGSYNANALYANDTWQYSIMSYWQQSNFGGGSTRYVMTPEIADILAVQMQYGASTSTRTGNTVYGFNATAGGIYNFAGYASAPALTIYDNGGNDTVDCSGYTANQVIDLRAGTYSSVGGLVNNIGIALNATIENAVGGAAATSSPAAAPTAPGCTASTATTRSWPLPATCRSATATPATTSCSSSATRTSSTAAKAPTGWASTATTTS